MSIKVSELTKLYGKQKALDQVSFEVQPGEVLGFIGPNGAGKTTAMKILTGYIAPTSGVAYVNDKSVEKNAFDIRKEIGYLPEHNPLYEEMYVKEYLQYVAGLYGMKKVARIRIEDIIEQTGLEKEKRKKIGALSKGYKQRVGLAQAIIHDPGVLILDEPTSGLDPNQIIEIRNLISSLGEKKTVMLSTHLMQEVEAICDRIIIINHGKIIADGKVDEIQKTIDQNKQTILVEFNTSVEQKLIEEIEGVNQVKKINETNWLVESLQEEDIRQRIFDFAVANNISVLSMQKKEQSLEEVFHELTR